MTPGTRAPETTVLFVGVESSRQDAMSAQVRTRGRVLHVADAAAAEQLVSVQPVNVVVAELRLPDGDGVTFFRRMAQRSPGVGRVLLAAYEDLPEAVRLRARDVVRRVIPRTATPQRVLEAVEEALSPPDTTTLSARGRPTLNWDQAAEYFEWSVDRIARVKDVVIRPLTTDASRLQLQFVLPASGRLDAFRADAVKQWLWPLKPQDGQPPSDQKDHPVLAMFGRLAPPTEIYAHQVTDERAWIYLALLPWQHERKVTAALGFLVEGSRPDLRALLELMHRRATSDVAGYPLPVVAAPTPTGGAELVAEYDWIVTPNYAGPDRRKEDTPLLGTFTIGGRRVSVPPGLLKVTTAFGDGLGKVARRILGAYAVLAVVDAALTLHGVRTGLVAETNPVLRPLVFGHPWLFLVVKNALALGAFLAVSRFQLHTWGVAFLSALTTGYALLDVYWVILLARVLG